MPGSSITSLIGLVSQRFGVAVIEPPPKPKRKNLRVRFADDPNASIDSAVPSSSSASSQSSSPQSSGTGSPQQLSPAASQSKLAEPAKIQIDQRNLTLLLPLNGNVPLAYLTPTGALKDLVKRDSCLDLKLQGSNYLQLLIRFKNVSQLQKALTNLINISDDSLRLYADPTVTLASNITFLTATKTSATVMTDSLAALAYFKFYLINNRGKYLQAMIALYEDEFSQGLAQLSPEWQTVSHQLIQALHEYRVALPQKPFAYRLSRLLDDMKLDPSDFITTRQYNRVIQDNHAHLMVSALEDAAIQLSYAEPGTVIADHSLLNYFWHLVQTEHHFSLNSCSEKLQNLALSMLAKVKQQLSVQHRLYDNITRLEASWLAEPLAVDPLSTLYQQTLGNQARVVMAQLPEQLETTARLSFSQHLLLANICQEVSGRLPTDHLQKEMYATEAQQLIKRAIRDFHTNEGRVLADLNPAEQLIIASQLLRATVGLSGTERQQYYQVANRLLTHVAMLDSHAWAAVMEQHDLMVITIAKQLAASYQAGNISLAPSLQSNLNLLGYLANLLDSKTWALPIKHEIAIALIQFTAWALADRINSTDLTNLKCQADKTIINLRALAAGAQGKELTEFIMPLISAVKYRLPSYQNNDYSGMVQQFFSRQRNSEKFDEMSMGSVSSDPHAYDLVRADSIKEGGSLPVWHEPSDMQATTLRHTPTTNA